MGTAFKCDVCGVLYSPEAGHLYEVEVYIRSRDGTDSHWDEIHLCSEHDERVWKIIRPALRPKSKK